MLKEFEWFRNRIRELRQFDQNGTIEKCFEYLKEIEKIDDNSFEIAYNKSEDNWFIHHNIALAYSKLDNHSKAIEYSNIGIEFTSRDLKDFHYLYCIWLLAFSYESLGNKAEAIKMYKKCSKGYKLIKDEEQRLSCLLGLAELLCSIKTIKKLLLYAQKNELNKVIDTHGELDKDSFIYMCYEKIISLYIKKGQNEIAYNFLNSINEGKAKIELKKILS